MKRNQFLALALTLSLSACGNRVDTVTSKYQAKPQIPVNASTIAVLYDFNPYAKSLQADSLYSQALVEGLEKWSAKRLYPIAATGVAQIKVTQASISKIPNVKYPESLEGCLDITISVIETNGAIRPYTEAKITQRVSAPPNMTDAEMATLKEALIIKLINGLDAEIEPVLIAKAKPAYAEPKIQAK